MSQFNSSLIGRYSRYRMKSSSPFATLLMDVGLNLCEDDVSSLRLGLTVDKFAKGVHLKQLKNGSEILLHMYNIGLISETDTQFLENLLIRIGRKDLVRRIDHYHAKRLGNHNATDGQKSRACHTLPDTTSENTVPKQVFEAYDNDAIVSSSTGTSCKCPMKSVENTCSPEGGMDLTDFTALKTPVMPVNQYYKSPQSVHESPFAILDASPAMSSPPSSKRKSNKSPVKGVMQVKSMADNSKGGGGDVTEFTALKTPIPQYNYQSPESVPNSPFAHLGVRSAPDGLSIPVFNSTVQNNMPSDPNAAPSASELSNSSSSSQEDVEMKNSQRCNGSQESQMSISDDEKIGLLMTDGDSSLSNMQLSQSF